ncbi:hypothetical protein Btru_077994 [Bulinus truncatus]|nr:hypothetical protein Btru_077994 [Bulinus truncatus]
MTRQLKKKFNEKVIDEDMTDDLENIRAINWSKSNSSLDLLAVSVPRDGNCLLHSVSLAIWGVEDDASILRELLYVTAINDTMNNFKQRWCRHYLHELSVFIKSSPEIIDREWQDVINNLKNVTSRDISAAVPHKFLEAVHIYILANILRRPIIVISGSFACSINGHKLQDNSIEEIASGKGSPKNVTKFNSAVLQNPSCTSNVAVSPSAPLMSGFQSEPLLSMLNERCRNNCGYRCSAQTYPFCHQCFVTEQNKWQQAEPHAEPTAPLVSEVSSIESNSFEIIPFPSGEFANPSYTEITWQEGENIYILKTPDTHESSNSEPNSHQALENLMGKILSVNSPKKVEPTPGEVLGSKASGLQKMKEEKLFHSSRGSESSIILPSSAQPFSPRTVQNPRGEPCIVSGCHNFGDPAEEDMCSSCYRKKMLQTSFLYAEAEKLTPLQSASFKGISQRPIHSSLNYTATGSSYYPSHSLTSQRSNIHMQESSMSSSESVPQLQNRIAHNNLQNKGSQTSPSELVTNVSTKFPHPAHPGSDEGNAVKNFNEIYERSVMKKRNELKCQRSECTNYGNPSRNVYCNACFDKYKKEILQANYGEDVPD